MSNLAVYAAVSAWADFGGSHIPSGPTELEPDAPDCWADYPLLIKAGVRSALYILWPESAHQNRDLERLRRDAGRQGIGFDNLVLRLGWEIHKRPVAAKDFIGLYREKIIHATRQGYVRLAVVPFNEPNVELVMFRPDGSVADTIMDPASFKRWYAAVVDAWKADPELGDIPLISPAVAGYAPNSWEWWNEALRDCCAISDFGGVHLYPSTDAEREGPWSLSWWLGQIPDKRLYLLEMGARTGTPGEARAALLPRLWRQVRDCERVDFAAAFCQWSKGREHREHWLTPPLLAQYIAVAGEAPSTAPAPQPPQEPTRPPFGLSPGRYRITLDVDIERMG